MGAGMEPEEIRGVREELQSKLAAALTYCHNPKHYQERLLEGALENVLLLKRRLCAPSMVSCVERALEKPGRDPVLAATDLPDVPSC